MYFICEHSVSMVIEVEFYECLPEWYGLLHGTLLLCRLLSEHSVSMVTCIIGGQRSHNGSEHLK